MISRRFHYLEECFFRRFVFPNLEHLGRDRIAAVRVNVARCYVSILENIDDLDETLKEVVRDKLRAMSKDPDFDVKRTARKDLDSKHEEYLFWAEKCGLVMSFLNVGLTIACSQAIFHFSGIMGRSTESFADTLTLSSTDV